MSAFGNYEKDEIYETVKSYIINSKKEMVNMPVSEIINELMQAVTYGIKNGLEEIETNESKS